MDGSAITCGKLGGISRLDMHFYSYRYTSSQLTEVAKQVLCVSIVQSSVDPTQLSDATLRNIVQNAYSASTEDEQNRMYSQLAAARDADKNPRLRAISDSSSPQASFALAVSRANNFTHPTLLSASAEPQYKPYSKAYWARLQINTASTNTESLKGWIDGVLYAEFDKYTAKNGIIVTAQVDPTSISNSEVIGQVTLMLSRELEDGEKLFSQKLLAALQGAASEKSPIPVLRFTIDGVAAQDHDGDESDDNFKAPHPINPDGPWPQFDEYGQEFWPADAFSDLGDLIDESEEVPESEVPNGLPEK